MKTHVLRLSSALMLTAFLSAGGSGAPFERPEGRAAGAEPQASIKPGTPPPAGREATYEWYAAQYPDPNLWTPIGPPGDPGDAAVSANGQLFSAAAGLFDHGLEPRLIPGLETGCLKHGLAFALFEDGKVVLPAPGPAVRQSALDGHLPVVLTEWGSGPISIRETAFAEPLRRPAYTGDDERTLAWASFDITNGSGEDREITFLVFYTGDEKILRPGLRAADGAVFLGDEALFSGRAEGALRLEFLPVFPAAESPTGGEASIRFLNDRSGVFNALVARGTLGPGKSARVIVNRVIDPGQNIYWPVKPEPPAVVAGELTARSFEGGFEKAKRSWTGLLRASPFTTPDPVLNDIARKAMLDGLFLTKFWNGNAIVYDSVMYRCQWDSSSTNWMYALDVSGDRATSERLLDTVFLRQGIRKPVGVRTREGCFSDVTNIHQDGSYASWASCNGWALWAMAEHARLTNDRAWVAKHKTAILDGCRWIIRERGFSREKQDNPCRGLIYGKFVCDLFPDSELGEAGYFAYTDAISFVGLNSTARLLADWGHAEGADLIREAEAYRRDIVEAVNRLADKSRDPWYVPWILSAPKYEKRYFHDIVGPVNLAYACGSGGVVPADDPLIDHSIRWILDKVHGGSIEDYVAGPTPPTLNKGSAFYSQDLLLALLERGRVEEFLRGFYTLLAAGIAHGTYTTTEWGDNTQPHIHSISSVLRMFRTMLVQERNGALILLQGTPRDWLSSGKTIAIDAAPTWYGPVSLKTTSELDGGRLSIELTIPERIEDTPVRIRLRLPGGYRLEGAKADGRALKIEDLEWLVVQGLRGRVRIDIRAVSL